MFGTFRGFLSRGRLPIRTHVDQFLNNGQYEVKRVRIIEPVLSRGRRRSIFFYFGVIYGTFVFLPDVLNFLDANPSDNDSARNKEALQKSAHTIGAAEKDKSKDGGHDGAGANGSIFIPLGWTREKPPRFYKASDPEWKAFAKLSRDPTKVNKLRRDLALLAFKAAGQNQTLAPFMGTESPPRLGRFWIDVDFPDGPPPEFERSGLEISPNNISWTTRPVAPHNYMRLKQALVPFSLFASFYASSFTLITMHYDRFMDLFRPYQPTQDEFEQELVKLQQRIRQHHPNDTSPFSEHGSSTSSPSPSPSPSSSPSSSSSSPPSTDASTNPLLSPSLPPLNPSSPSSSPLNPFPKPPSTSSSQQDDQDDDRPPWFPPSSSSSSYPSPSSSSSSHSNSSPNNNAAPAPPDGEEWPDSWHIASMSIAAFKRTLARTWRPVQTWPTPGSVHVTGLVEVHGEHATVVLDVFGVYNVMQNNYTSVHMKLRRMARRKQMPRGGL
ncbi:hypothetical protein L228DRAFT_279297 [Xylona heveae TC161]|uniref:Uncharacterized protein n=1 Tax=Xylona heveae (strain CBS 132557 / TC161) TaxID=1328760 RepID=A0A165JCE2_XYLHT|nr:hypothetical protein L228DRAFT_279297 [Xylona heveae TC161]KZF26049.1 hypothetical protein L228DRAFT_279297 [Xylona heveae TC161]